MCPAEIDAIVKDAWVGHPNGRLTANEMEILDEAAGAGREAIQTRRTEARKPRTAPSSAPRGSARSLQSIRSRTRRRLHEPRPAVSDETRKRIGQWKAEIKEAAKARQIRAVDRLYADELLAFPSVARGLYNLCSDATMGQRLDISDSTARRQRRRLDKAGLIEVLGYGQDGNSCLVRPILRDGTPVFPDPEMPSRPVNSDHPPRVRSKVMHSRCELSRYGWFRSRRPP
jgi:DNA-binding transcriptional ArsR family regulator